MDIKQHLKGGNDGQRFSADVPLPTRGHGWKPVSLLPRILWKSEMITIPGFYSRTLQLVSGVGGSNSRTPQLVSGPVCGGVGSNSRTPQVVSGPVCGGQ